jgi:hypothetical protein
MKKQIAAIVMMAIILPGAHAQTVLSNLTLYWNANTTTPTNTTSSNGIFGNWISAAPTFSQFNNFGTTVLINSTSASPTNAGFSGGDNFGMAVGTLNSTDPRPFSIDGPAFAFAVTLTNAAHQIRITDFDFGSRRTSTGPQAVTLLASTFANFSSPTTVFDITSGQTNGTWVFNNGSFNAVNFSSNQVFFRLYAYNGQGNASQNTANWRIDDITLSASVIPEPSTYVLIALAFLGVFFFARRRKAPLKA